MKKIAILGCGYVGKACAERWKASGHVVTAATRRSERLEQLAPLSSRQILLREEKAYRALLLQQDHLLIAVAPDPGKSYEETYLAAAERVIRNISSSLQQIIYLSSTSVYGDHQGNWVDEETIARPCSSQALILLQTEELLHRHLSPSLCILRLGEIIGPGREISLKLRSLPSFPGTGENWTNLIHLEDLVSLIDFVFRKNLTGVYNACSDLHIPRKELYEKIASKNQLAPPRWDPSRCSPHAGNKRVSNAKIRRAGFEFAGIDSWLQEM